MGKTSVAKALASKLKAQRISLSELVEKENLALEVDEKRDTVVADLRKTSKRIKEIIRESTGDVIVEGHYAQDVVPKSLAPYVFVLRRDPEELKTEFESRGYGEQKIAENVTSEILDICLIEAIRKYGLERVDEIDTTKRSVEEVVDEVLKVLDGQRKCRAGTVDWLGKLEAEGRLDKVLPLLNKT